MSFKISNKRTKWLRKNRFCPVVFSISIKMCLQKGVFFKSQTYKARKTREINFATAAPYWNQQSKIRSFSTTLSCRFLTFRRASRPFLKDKCSELQVDCVHTDENILTSQQGYYYKSDLDALQTIQCFLFEVWICSYPAVEHKYAHHSIIAKFSRHLKPLCLPNCCFPLPA
jgi:hypothetical protein